MKKVEQKKKVVLDIRFPFPNPISTGNWTEQEFYYPRITLVTPKGNTEGRNTRDT